MTPRSTLDDFRAMMIAEDNLIQKISFMSEGKIQVALLFVQLTKISIFHERESLLMFLFVSLDGEFRLAYCTSLESIETRKFRMRINETEFLESPSFSHPTSHSLHIILICIVIISIGYRLNLTDGAL